MKWIKYLHRTPIAQIRADWTEYVNLCRQCVALRMGKRVAYDRIVAMVNAENDLQTKSCVCQQYCYANQFYNHGSDALGDCNMIWVRHSVCRKFDKTGSGTKCAESQCSCVERNHEYVDACARYNVMRQARRDFWRIKFAKAAQNVK